MQIHDEVKKCYIFLAVVSVAFVVTALVVCVYLFYPQVAATRYSYFDLNNGVLKLQWVSFGRIYRESVEETDYSKLLKSLEIAELPADWRQANAEEIGIRRFLYPQNVSYHYGKVASDARVFSIWLGLLDNTTPQEKLKYVMEFRTLLQKGTPQEIGEHVKALQQGKS